MLYKLLVGYSNYHLGKFSILFICSSLHYLTFRKIQLKYILSCS